MAKPSKQVIIDYIISCLKKGEERGKVLAKVVSKWQLSTRTFDRQWKIANQQHAEQQKQLNKELAEVDKQMAIEARKRDIIEVDERKEILSMIARGGIPLTKAMVVDGKIQHVDVVPDWMDRKNAIAELNKMDGTYAPEKKEISGKFSVEKAETVFE